DVKFLNRDMRDVSGLDQEIGAAMCLWQSFGYFDAATNQRILADIASGLRAGGGFVLDIYHRGFFDTRQGSLEFERNGRRVREVKSMTGDRLLVELCYDDSATSSDRIEWQIFYPDEMIALAAAQALELVACCRDFDESLRSSPDHPRMQLVFQKA